MIAANVRAFRATSRAFYNKRGNGISTLSSVYIYIYLINLAVGTLRIWSRIVFDSKTKFLHPDSSTQRSLITNFEISSLSLSLLPSLCCSFYKIDMLYGFSVMQILYFMYIVSINIICISP